eukprot:TRINITY_DN20278_c0_g1_i1.p1 TRINITY_DN20278_c0_g1~~TRINITY_DN20278_c0_g1_i1.p1  ORF type:complete len:942 (+),score=178.19 TRINITY_DN20278_c0_g1_i1:210-2828(+)
MAVPERDARLQAVCVFDASSSSWQELSDDSQVAAQGRVRASITSSSPQTAPAPSPLGRRAGSAGSAPPRSSNSPRHQPGRKEPSRLLVSPLGTGAGRPQQRPASPAGAASSPARRASPARCGSPGSARSSPGRGSRDASGRWVQSRLSAAHDPQRHSPLRNTEFRGRAIGPDDYPPGSAQRFRDPGVCVPLRPQSPLPAGADALSQSGASAAISAAELDVEGRLTSQSRVFNHTLERLRSALEEERSRRVQAEQKLQCIRFAATAANRMWVQRDLQRDYFSKWVLWVRGGAWIGTGAAVTKFFSQLGAAGSMRGSVADADDLYSPARPRSAVSSPIRSPIRSPGRRNDFASPQSPLQSPVHVPQGGGAKGAASDGDEKPEAGRQPWRPPGIAPPSPRHSSPAGSPARTRGERTGSVAGSAAGSVGSAASPTFLRSVIARERQENQRLREEFKVQLDKQVAELTAKMDRLQSDVDAERQLLKDEQESLRCEKLVSLSLRNRLMEVQGQLNQLQSTDALAHPGAPSAPEAWRPPGPAAWWRPLRSCFEAAAGAEEYARRSVLCAVAKAAAAEGKLPRGLVDEIGSGGEGIDGVGWDEVESIGCAADPDAGQPPLTRKETDPAVKRVCRLAAVALGAALWRCDTSRMLLRLRMYAQAGAGGGGPTLPPNPMQETDPVGAQLERHPSRASSKGTLGRRRDSVPRTPLHAFPVGCDVFVRLEGGGTARGTVHVSQAGGREVHYIGTAGREYRLKLDAATEARLSRVPRQGSMVSRKSSKGSVGSRKPTPKPAFDAARAADTLHQAMTGRWRADESAVLSALEGLQSAADWDLLVQVFSTRWQSFFNGDLRAALTSELSAVELGRAQDVIRSCGVEWS